MKNVGLKIRRSRKVKGISQGELAKEVRRTQTWISLIEMGRFVPAPEMIEKIEKAIDRLAEMKAAIAVARERAEMEIVSKFAART